jgi:hypothetical protein
MALVCSRLIAGIAGSDPAEGMDVDLLCLLEAFPKFQQATISFVIPIRLSVCLSIRMQQLGYHWTDFDKI